MKQRIIYSFLSLSLLPANCTKNFEAINTDPTQANAATFDPELVVANCRVGLYKRHVRLFGAHTVSKHVGANLRYCILSQLLQQW